MRQFLASLAVCALLSGNCGAAPAVAREHSVVTDDTTTLSPTHGAASSLSTVSPLPSRPPIYQMGPRSVPEGQIGAALSPGQVTGYGAGGTARVPGSPPNPPYR